MNNLEEFPTKEFARLCAKCHIGKAYAFGSFARGDQRPDSDLDVMIERVDNKASLKTMRSFPIELAKLVNRDVDVVTTDIMRNRVFAHEMAEYGKLLYSV